MEKSIEASIRNFDLKKTIAHIRKNHALEHATIHVLSAKFPHISLGGYSFNKGFWIIGKTQIQEVQEAVDIARARLKNGERELAVHPNCGTNLAIAGVCSALLSLVVLAGANSRKERLGRFSSLMAAGMVGAYVSKPFGMTVQKSYTTDPDISGIAIVSINSSDFEGMPIFFVETHLEQDL